MYHFFLFNLRKLILALFIGIPFFSFSLSEELEFKIKKHDFDQHYNLQSQRVLQKKRQKKIVLQNTRKLKKQRDEIRVKAAYNRIRKNRKMKAELLLQSFLNPYVLKPNVKNRIQRRKKEKLLKKKYSTPLDIHLFSKPLSIKKK